MDNESDGEQQSLLPKPKPKYGPKCGCCGAKGIIILLLCSVLVSVFWTSGVYYIMKKRFILVANSCRYDMWQKTPIPIYMDITLFNWTNPGDVRNMSVKPNFVEFGPYVFLEERQKDDVVFNENNTVSYSNTRTWYFQPQLSNGSLDDIVTGPNMISATVADQTKNENVVVKKFVINTLLKQYGSLTKTKSVREWLFDGYSDPLITIGNFFNKSGHPNLDKFGWFYGRNGSKTFEGRFTVKSGVDDESHMGDLVLWNGSNKTGYFEGDCGKVNGSTGDLWPIFIDSSKGLTMFSTDLGRFFNLESGPKITYFDIEGYQYRTNNESLGSGESYPCMKCFCHPENRKCTKDGVLDVSSVRDGAPAFVSFPHFYMADKSYRDAISGMKPNETEHRFVLSMEPTLGVPLKIQGSFQINIQLMSDPDYKIYKDIKSFLAPVLWMRERGSIDEGKASSLRLLLSLPFLAEFICLGVIGVTLGFVLLQFAISRRRGSDYQRVDESS